MEDVGSSHMEDVGSSHNIGILPASSMSCEHQHGASGSDGAASEAGHFPARRLPSRLNLFLPFSSAVAEASPYPLASKCAHCNRNLEAGGAEARWGTGLCDESGSLDAALTCPSFGDLHDSRARLSPRPLRSRRAGATTPARRSARCAASRCSSSTTTCAPACATSASTAARRRAARATRPSRCTSSTGAPLSATRATAPSRSGAL